MNEEQSRSIPGLEQWAAYQKIWSDTFQKMFQLGMTSPHNGGAPPEMVRQLRSSIFQAMAQAWDEFLRSPQFLDGMKQWMESAIAFRQVNKDVLMRFHQENQTPSTEDIDAVLVAVRRVEHRLTEQLEDLSEQIKELKQSAPAAPAPAKTPPTRGASRRAAARNRTAKQQETP